MAWRQLLTFSTRLVAELIGLGSFLEEFITREKNYKILLLRLDLNKVDMFNGRAEEGGAEEAKLFRIVGNKKSVMGWGGLRVEEVVIFEELFERLRAEVCGIDDMGMRKGFLDLGLKERVVSASENDGVDILVLKRLKVFLESECGERMVQISLFD